MFFVRKDPSGNTSSGKPPAGKGATTPPRKGEAREAAPEEKPDAAHPAARDRAMDQDRQAEALEAAAEEGVPFCEECEQKKADKSAEAEALAAGDAA